MKKINYFIMTLAVAGTLLFSCHKKTTVEPVNNGPAPISLWLTSFEPTPDSTNQGLFMGSYWYGFGCTFSDTVTKGAVGVPTTSVSGKKFFHMTTTNAGAYYGGGFGWNPGSGHTFDTLDINDQFRFSYNYNGNTVTSLKAQLVDPVDGDVFILVIPSGGTGWQTATLLISDFTWDATDPANLTGTHDKKMNVNSLGDFKFIYYNATAGMNLEVNIDDLKVIDNAGGTKVLQ